MDIVIICTECNYRMPYSLNPEQTIDKFKCSNCDKTFRVDMKLLVNMQKSHISTNNFKARPGVTYEAVCACGSMYLTCNEKEVFIRIGKAGGCASALNESVGKLISAYLQKGGELSDVVKLLAGVSCHSANKEVLSCIGAAAEILKEQNKGVL